MNEGLLIGLNNNWIKKRRDKIPTSKIWWVSDGSVADAPLDGKFFEIVHPFIFSNICYYKHTETLGYNKS